jgi:predicted dienelactone hydrolase
MTNGGGTTAGGGTSSTGGTSNAGGACDEEATVDAGLSLDAGSGSDLAKVGPYAVGHVNYTLADPAVYARPVIVSVFYPVDPASITTATPPAQYPPDPWSSNVPVWTSADWETLGYDRAYEAPTASSHGPFPLVMVSPGYKDGNWEYFYIGTRLASHGYVVAVIDHDHEGQFVWSLPAGDYLVSMFNRPRDVSFAITELLLKNANVGELLHTVIEPSKIAMSGHSFGGYTAYVLAGGDDDVCDALATGIDAATEPQDICVASPPDPRIRAIVSLDGSSWAMRYEELARISVPSLIMGETPDNFGLDNARPHAAINRDDSYRIDVKGTNHLSFSSFCDGFKLMSRIGVDEATAIPGYSEDRWPCVADASFDPANNPAYRQIVTSYMLGFLNTYLGREDDSWMLTASYAKQHQPQVEFFSSEGCGATPPSQDQYTCHPHTCQCSVGNRDPFGYFAPPIADGGAP